MLDPTRTKRQIKAVIKWGRAGCRGTFEGATGFGKTRVAMEAIKRLTSKVPPKKDYKHKVIVIVPTTILQETWNQKLANEGLKKFAEVLIINSAIKERLECQLLILDEIHQYGAPVFSQVFKTIKYEAVLGLTATMPENNERYRIISHYAPVFDKVNMSEALRNGWTSEYIINNIPVQLTKDEYTRYKEASSLFSKGFAYFEHDLQLMYAVIGNRVDVAKMAEEFGITKGQLYGMAKNAGRGLSIRNEIVKTCQAKKDLALEVAKLLPDKKIITFSSTVDFVNEITEMMVLQGIPAEPYHSKIKGRIIDGKKYSAKDTKSMIIDSFAHSNKTMVINSARALDQGVDIPKINVGLILSGTSSILQAIQRYGRTNRKDEDKVSIIIEAYAQDTQDEVWLEKRQASVPEETINYITSLSEIF